MNLAELLKREIPTFDHIAEAPIGQAGWECSYMTTTGAPLGGAVHADRELCRKIGLAEALERHYISRLSDKTKQDFFCPEFPSSCGFAFGFDSAGARQRSECEAVERWIWSKWIDEHFRIPHVPTPKLSDLAQVLSGRFDEVVYYAREFQFLEQKHHLGITLARKDGGVFAGSRVSRSSHDLWTHALSESMRHQKIFEHCRRRTPRDFIEERICFFGRNGERALEQVARATRDEWPTPTVLMQKSLALPHKFFLYRTLCADYLGWHDGTVERFVY